jgi:hypothetical protein
MKKFTLCIVLVSLLLGTIKSLAQDTASVGSLNSGTIDSQFEYIYKISNNFQEYKVVKRTDLDKLKSNILDSMKTMRGEVLNLKAQIAAQSDSVNQIRSQLVMEKTEKEEAIAAKEEFSFLGIGIQKGVYSLFMWLLVGALGLALAFFSVQFFRSFGKIKKANRDLLEVQEEFEQHRKNTLERERKMKRELIDAQMGKK